MYSTHHKNSYLLYYLEELYESFTVHFNNIDKMIQIPLIDLKINKNDKCKKIYTLDVNFKYDKNTLKPK